MNKVFRRMPLMAKLLIIALVPLLFIGYLTVNLYAEKSNNLAQIKSYLDKVRQSATISRLSDQLQKERRYSFNFVLTKSGQDEMIAQRPQTDIILKELKKEHDKSLKDFPSYTFLEKLDSVRKLVDSSRYNANMVMHFYSSAIFRLNTLNRIPALNNAELQSANDNMTAQRLLSDLSTYLGIISANVYNVLYTRQYMVETLLGTYPSWDVYKTYQKEFAIKADKDVLKRFNTIHTNGAFHLVDTYLDKLFSSFKFDSSYNYKSWSVVADSGLAEIRSLQMDLLKQVESRVTNYYSTEYKFKERTITYLVIMIIVLIALVSYILYIINQTLRQLRKAALKLSEGETGIGIEQESDDIIGNLAHSIRTIDKKNKELAIAAQKIGDGNFDVALKPRSDRDMLGNSIVNMQAKLLRYTNDLKKSRDEFETLADLMPQIVWVADEKGEITYYNRKWDEITGAIRAGNKQDWAIALHPDDVDRTVTAWRHSIQSGNQFEIEYRLRNVQATEYRWFLGRAIPVTDKENRIIKWFGTATDIHDKKMQETRLEELVKLRTLELNRSNEDLQQFAHVASHDLKEPLRKIRTFGDRLEQEFGEFIPEKGKTYLDKLKTSSERMSNMIEGILSYSVINATGSAKETVDLNAVIENIKHDLELLIIQKNAQIIHNHFPEISGVHTLLYQLFYNLIANALKFSKQGVPPVITMTANTISKDEVVALVDGKGSAQYLHITIADNGIGFNQEYADQMFNAFTRLNDRRQYEGTGLGLALCKKIVQRHDGAIYANGKEGIGSTFHVILPITF